MTLPARKPKPRLHENKRRFPGHRTWVRGHLCVVTTSANPTPCDGGIECAHVDRAGGKGMGYKVADWFTVSLCRAHHAEYHRGAATFEKRYGLDLVASANEFTRKSPHYPKMKEAMK